jgi:hypothetical protein
MRYTGNPSPLWVASAGRHGRGIVAGIPWLETPAGAGRLARPFRRCNHCPCRKLKLEHVDGVACPRSATQERRAQGLVLRSRDQSQLCHDGDALRRLHSAGAPVPPTRQAQEGCRIPQKNFGMSGIFARNAGRQFSHISPPCRASLLSRLALDNTSWLDPKVHVYCDSAERWTPIPEGSQKFGKMAA